MAEATNSVEAGDFDDHQYSDGLIGLLALALQTLLMLRRRAASGLSRTRATAISSSDRPEGSRRSFLRSSGWSAFFQESLTPQWLTPARVGGSAHAHSRQSPKDERPQAGPLGESCADPRGYKANGTSDP